MQVRCLIMGVGPRLVPGMVLAIEPMVNEGTYVVDTRMTAGLSSHRMQNSAHFEHTVSLRKTGQKY